MSRPHKTDQYTNHKDSVPVCATRRKVQLHKHEVQRYVQPVYPALGRSRQGRGESKVTLQRGASVRPAGLGETVSPNTNDTEQNNRKNEILTCQTR